MEDLRTVAIPTDAIATATFQRLFPNVAELVKSFDPSVAELVKSFDPSVAELVKSFDGLDNDEILDDFHYGKSVSFVQNKHESFDDFRYAAAGTRF